MVKYLNYLSFITALVLLCNLFVFVRGIYPAPKEYPNHIHRTIYVERRFDDFEQEQIIAAAMEWTEITNHIIEFDIVQLPSNGRMDPNGIYINITTPDHPDVILLDKTNGGTTLAYFDHNSRLPYIGMINARITNKDYKAVVMHELGHAIGLDHNYGEEGIGTLMYPSINGGSYHVEKLDGERLCKLYHCDPTKLKYQEESLHF